VTVAQGTRLGPYEVLSPLGAGGMGEVYRARDTRLGRDVAIKVLPASFASDKDRLHRFEQEASAAGTLNHPNILSIHDVGTHDGAPYVVSELLEGDTLRRRLSGTALPQRRAIDYALQLANGLAAAHEKGIVHRDLKPENVFITKDGRVKILDFGLAKLIQVNGNEAQSNVPTRRADTDPGIVLGTVGYMSPEQVRGRPLDHRSDIFAFGAILYEMLSGQRAFRGDSPADTMSAILREDPPDLSSTNHTVSTALERLVDHCLEKNPEERFHSARDLAFALEALSASTASFTETVTIATAPPRRLGRRELISWSLASLLFVSAVVLAVLAFRTKPSKQGELSRFYIQPPEKTSFSGATDFISPDGRKLVFTVIGPDGWPQLWIRSMDSVTARPIPGTDVSSQAFWSPDSRFIAFYSRGKLRKVDINGGPVQALADAQTSRGGTWNKDGLIVFAPAFSGGLYRVSAAGGEISAVTKIDAARGESGHFWPQFLPDGHHFIYLIRTANKETTGIYLGSLESTDKLMLVQSEAGARFAAPGYLLFLKESILMAQPFNAQTFQLSGEPTMLSEQVASNPQNGRSFFCTSDNGILVYRAAIRSLSTLRWFDRTGKDLGSIGSPDTRMAVALSPDEKRIAIVRADQSSGSDIWVIDIARQSTSRLTFDPAIENNPVWSPDGNQIAFSSNRSGPYNLYWKSSSGSGDDVLLLKSETAKFVTDWSSDGRYILYADSGAMTGGDLWALPLFGDQKPIPVVQSTFEDSQGRFSHDAHWIAYVSTESGTPQVYVQTFPVAGGKWMISTNGGWQPRWRADGKELFYYSLDNKLMSVEVKTNGNNLEASNPTSLFAERVVIGPPSSAASYAVNHDGQRFLMNSLPEESSPVPAIVVQNWTAALRN
jgi:serine/threonine protein kinase